MTEETHAPVVTAPPQPPQTTPEVEAPRASIQSGVVEESPPSLRYVETEEDYEPTIELNLDKLPETLPYGRSERAPHPSEPTPAKPEFAPPAEPPHIPLPKLASAHDDYEKTVRLEQHSFPSSSSFPSPPPHAPDPKAVESHAGPPLLPESKLKPPRPKKSINTAQVVKDIREGLTDDELMKRHELVPLQLKKLFRKLVEAKAMTLEEIENRKGKAA
jgi:hypothetical protein